MRIPTYFFRKTLEGLEVIGPGVDNFNIFPNLVFVRDSDFRFIFDSSSSVIEILDSDNNILFNGNEFENPVIFRFGRNFPNEIKYRLKNANENEYGKIFIRDLNNISGKVISYGYSKNTSVKDDKTKLLTTDSNGKFSLNLLDRIESDLDTYFVNFDLTSFGGFDASVLNVNSETYSDELEFIFKAKPGCLHISSLSTLFYNLKKKLTKVNFRETESKIKNYFGFSEKFDPISDDPIYGYLSDKIPLSDFAKFILFTCIIEYESIMNEDSEDLIIYEKIADEIIEGNKKFSFVTFNNLISKKENQMSNSFPSLYLILSTRLQNLSDVKTKKVCVLESVYNLIYKFRNTVFKNIISNEAFLSDNFSVNYNSINIPTQSYKMLVSYIDGCSVAPFGKYAKINVTSQLVKNILNQMLPIEPEIANSLLNKTIYIKNDSSDYYCYKIIDYIDYDYELEEIKSDQIIQGFDNSLDCCTLETISAKSIQEKNILLEIDSPTENILDFKLFSLDKTEIKSFNITNKNKPYFKSLDTNDTDNYFIDEHLYTANKQSYTPAFIVAPKNQTRFIKNNEGIEISYDGKIKNYQADHIRYNYEIIDIENANLALDNNILTFETKFEHGYTKGQTIVIKNSSKEILNGEFEIVGVSKKVITISYNLPEGYTKKDVDGEYGQIESLNFTKIYTSVRDFAVHDEIFFEKFNNSKSYIISSIQKDYIGSYLVVEGVVPRNCKNFTRKSKIHIIKTLKYSRSKKPEIYQLENADGTLLDLEKYDVFSPSQPGAVTVAGLVKILSNIKIVVKDSEIADESDDLISQDYSKINTENHKKHEINTAIAYHYSRRYLRENYDIEEENTQQKDKDIWDWNGDGVIGRDELKILERFVMTRPNSIEEYNRNRENYPFATTLPTYNTAQYACQGHCCHDDYTETDDYNIDDVYIYDAFQAYMDDIGQTNISDETQFLEHYDSLEAQGIVPWLFDEMAYMPSNPAEGELCGDFTKTGSILADDANIYYIHQMYYDEMGESPSDISSFNEFYTEKVNAGLVPTLLNQVKKLPSLAFEDTITDVDGFIDKACDEISQKDIMIYYEWIRQGKPTDLNQFNETAKSFMVNFPRACFLPVDEDDFAPDEYEDFGFSSFTFDQVDIGLENL